jgi:nucleoside-triphosphatase
LAVKIYITGPPRSGKTTLIMKILPYLEKLSLRFMGFVTPEQSVGGERKGFNLFFLPWGRQLELASIEQKPGYNMKHGRYWLNPSAGKEIASVLREAINNEEIDLIIVDEIGPMELAFREFREAIEDSIVSQKNVIATFHISLSSRFPHIFSEIEKGLIIDLRRMGWEEAHLTLLERIKKVKRSGGKDS